MEKFVSADNLLLAYDYFSLELGAHRKSVCIIFSGEHKFTQEELRKEWKLLHEEWQEKIVLMKNRFGDSNILRIFAHLNRDSDGSTLEKPNIRT